jgi:phenylpropionate dioxygenase-like ring-hydroxylating dioxygenase large terminal subunit
MMTEAVAYLHKNMMPFYYPLNYLSDLPKTGIHKFDIMGEPLVCYHNRNNSYIVHTDVCPHQGASLSKGWVNEDGNLQCPYHGFEFCLGEFCKIPNPECSPPRFRSKTRLPLFPTHVTNDMLFVSPMTSETPPPPFYPPEEYDSNFRAVTGSRVIDQNYMMVCENLLDMIHISYVHSFGNTFSPLPLSIQFRNLSSTSGRTEFLYRPPDLTISGKVGKVSKVFVQNEYHLPTNTITRVKAGQIIKTVFTRSLPISENKTLLFWKVYRNFWKDPFVEEFSWFGDVLMKHLMKLTVQEDVNILKNVYPEHRRGFKTKYDVTISNFRKDVEKSLQNVSSLSSQKSNLSYLQVFHVYDTFQL